VEFLAQHLAVSKDGKETLFSIPVIIRREDALLHDASDEVRLIMTEWPVIPEPGRPFDKARAAADTASLGYVLRNLLLLPRVEKGTGLDDDDRQHDEGASSHWRTNEQVKEAGSLMAQLGIRREDMDETVRGLAFGADLRRASVYDEVIKKLKAKVANHPPSPPSEVKTTTTEEKQKPTEPPLSSESSVDASTEVTSTKLLEASASSSQTKTEGSQATGDSITAKLLALKVKVDGFKTSKALDTAVKKWDAALNDLGPGASAVARSYIRARANELDGVKTSEEDEARASSLNELAKS
jgi:hypothetical protein